MCKKELVVDSTSHDDESVVGDECHWRRDRNARTQGRGSKTRERACHPAALYGTLPDMEAELDCRLQSNSR
jgi:hypothetical protein